MIRLLVSLPILALFMTTATAAETLELKYRPKTTVRYQREQKTEQVLTIGENVIESGSTTFSVVTHTSGERADDGSLAITERHEVLQAEIAIAGMTLQFDSANPDAEPSNPALSVFSNLLRTTFRTPITTVVDGEGQIREVTIPPQARAEIDPAYATLFDPKLRKHAAQQVRAFLPDGPVDPGATWERDIDADLGNRQTLGLHARFEYAGVVEEGERRLHRILSQPQTVVLNVDPTAPGPVKVSRSDLKVVESEGEYLFDAERGAIVREQSRLKVSGTLTLLAGDQELPGEVTFTIRSKLSLQP